MPAKFTNILLYGRQRAGTSAIPETLQRLSDLLNKKQLGVAIETSAAPLLSKSKLPSMSFAAADQYDLIIVVGGDGSLLTAAHAAVEHNIPIVGINRGRLGFLTDITPSQLEQQISAVLDGQYREEQRFLLHTTISRDGECRHTSNALNDVVLALGDNTHMIEFEIAIDQQLVCSQRADGLIVATPTGSTAYALSGGGPIIHTGLDAIVMVPMFPHTLSSRPIVVSSESNIRIRLAPSDGSLPKISCDGHGNLEVTDQDDIVITRKPEMLRLLHPLNYNYFETLRSKLGWEAKH